MKKLIVATIAVACAFIPAAAVACGFTGSAESVQDQNLVGYTKVTVSDGALSLVALNFIPCHAYTPHVLTDQLPLGTTVHIWDKAFGSYASVTYIPTRCGNQWQSFPLDIGDSFWVELPPGSGTHDLILTGQVKDDALSTTIGGDIDATGYYYPVATAWGDTDLSEILGAGATLHLWTGSNYVSHVKTLTRSGLQWSAEAKAVVLDPAEGFWIQAPSTNWTEALPYTP